MDKKNDSIRNFFTEVLIKSTVGVFFNLAMY